MSILVTSLLTALIALTLENILPWPEKAHPLNLARLIILRVKGKVKPSDTDDIKQHWISGGLAYFVIFTPILVVIHLFITVSSQPIFFDVLVMVIALRFTPHKQAFLRVSRALKQQKKPLARDWLSRLVKRQSDNLSEIGIAKAAIESFWLRWNYQVACTLFVFFCGGSVLAFAYRIALECKWHWSNTNNVHSYFNQPVSWICRICQFIPAVIIGCLCQLLSLLSWSSNIKREHADIQAASVKRFDIGTFLLNRFAVNLGFNLGGPRQYGQDKIRFPRIGAPYQVKLIDMQRTQFAIWIMNLIIVCTLCLALLAAYL